MKLNPPNAHRSQIKICEKRQTRNVQFRFMQNAFRILKPIQKSSKCVWMFAKNQTRLPKTKRVWPMKINVICTVHHPRHTSSSPYIIPTIHHLHHTSIPTIHHPHHTVQITFIFIDFRVCDFAFAFKTQNAPCVSRFKRVLFSDRFQFAF